MTNNNKLSEKFIALADGMTKAINDKLHSAIGQQRPTARRAKIAEHMEREGRELQKIQAALYKLAECHQSGDIPASLQRITNKAQVTRIISCYKLWDSIRKPLASTGINTEDKFQQAKAAIDALISESTIAPDPVEVEIRKAERELIGVKIPGFYITPKEVAFKLVGLAEIEPGMSILEPSAGSGSIAEAIQEQCPSNTLEVIEYSYRLCEILKLKGFEVLANDFLETQGSYDRIIMNPPFEQGIDIDHVRHAYDCLNPGGRIVAIMSAGVFFRGDKKREDFREWLDNLGATSEELPAGTFAKELTSTGVTSRIVVIDKPGAFQYVGVNTPEGMSAEDKAIFQRRLNRQAMFRDDGTVTDLPTALTEEPRATQLSLF